MRMKDSAYQHLCTLILGFSAIFSIFRFIGYDFASIIVESLVHSAHARDPKSIIQHAGYYGQAVKEISICLTTFLVPAVLNYLSPKCVLVIGSGLFACNFVCFFFINNIVYFIANILLGVGFALIYTSFNTCQMAFSSRQSLARNSSRVQGIANLSLICGGFLYIYITMTHPEASTDVQYRYYSEDETRTMSAFLVAYCVINLVLTCCLPTRERYPMMTAYYAFAMCAGTTLCGFVVAPLNRRFNDFGLRPLYYITVVVQLIAYSFAVITVPSWSTARPTDESALIRPHLLWVILTAFLLGFGDSSNVASNSVVCSRLLPGRAAHTYSAARFYRGVAASTIFFSSPLLTMRAHAVILISVSLISALSFHIALKQVESRDERLSMKKKTEVGLS